MVLSGVSSVEGDEAVLRKTGPLASVYTFKSSAGDNCSDGGGGQRPPRASRLNGTCLRGGFGEEAGLRTNV